MKLPGGYGTVYKLKDKPRRKPWAVKVNGRYIGYAKTKREGLDMLAGYHSSPDEDKKMTFSDVYELWVKQKSGTVCKGTVTNYASKYRTYCGPLYDKVYRDLRPRDFLDVLNSRPDVSNGTKNKTIQFLKAMDRFACELDLIDRKATDSITMYKKDTRRKEVPFSENEISMLWKSLDIEDVDLILILLYTGLRSGEFAKLKLSDIHLTEDGADYDYIMGGSKTEAGRDRYIPIHPLIKNFIVDRMGQAKRDTLLNYSAKQFRIRFKRVMEKLGMEHIPHECRHTFITRMDDAGANRVCLDLIVGHKSSDVGESVYTHKTYAQLQEEVRKLT